MKKAYKLINILIASLVLLAIIAASYCIYLAINSKCDENSLCSYDYVYIAEYILFVAATTLSFLKALNEFIFRREFLLKVNGKITYVQLILLLIVAICSPIVLIQCVDILSSNEYLIRGAILVLFSIIIVKDFTIQK